VNLAVAIIIGAALIAGAIAISHRYAIVSHACGTSYDCSYAWRVDQWSGRTMLCETQPPQAILGHPFCVSAPASESQP
jgi:hypothetical protein